MNTTEGQTAQQLESLPHDRYSLFWLLDVKMGRYQSDSILGIEMYKYPKEAKVGLKQRRLKGNRAVSRSFETQDSPHSCLTEMVKKALLWGTESGDRCKPKAILDDWDTKWNRLKPRFPRSRHPFHSLKAGLRVGEKDQRLTTLAALPEDWGLVPSTHTMAHKL